MNTPLLDYAMAIAHERELEVTGHKHDTEGAVRRFIAACERRGEPVAWQFYDQGRWWNGDDRIKDHRENTENAGYTIRNLYAGPIYK